MEVRIVLDIEIDIESENCTLSLYIHFALSVTSK